MDNQSRNDENQKHEELLVRALAGSEADRDALILSVRPMVEGVIRKRNVKNEADVQDLTQNVLLAASMNLDKYRRESGFAGWVAGIAKHMVANYYARILNRQQNTESLESFFDSDMLKVKQNVGDVSPDSKVAYQQYVSRLVEIAESECSDIEFAVLLMVLDDEKYPEIARITGLPEARARQHALRAREKLLGHIVLHEVELMGGRADVEMAWRIACASPDSRFLPSPEEKEAWENPEGRAKAFRRAALKMAKWLPLTLIVAELLKRGEVIWKTH